jgi:hypothetical protein
VVDGANFQWAAFLMTTLEQLQSAKPPTLLHVVSAENFPAARIVGFRNTCVCEMALLDQVKTLELEPAALLVVYTAGERSLNASPRMMTASTTGQGVFEFDRTACGSHYGSEETVQLPRPTTRQQPEYTHLTVHMER